MINLIGSEVVSLAPGGPLVPRLRTRPSALRKTYGLVRQAFVRSGYEDRFDVAIRSPQHSEKSFITVVKREDLDPT
jgi:hypothetical protein